MNLIQGMHVEGKAKFKVGNAFYRPKSQVARDLGVLAAAIYRFDTGSLQVLEAMAGCGGKLLALLEREPCRLGLGE